MNQEQIWKMIEAGLTENQALLLESGVRLSQIKLKTPDLEKPLKEFKAALEYFTNFEKFIYELKKVKALLPDEIWVAYAKHNITGLRETVMLNEAKRNVLIAWRLRPELIKKAKNARTTSKNARKTQRAGSKDNKSNKDADGSE